MNKNNKPKIRFKGFTDFWAHRKFLEVITMYERIGCQNLKTSGFLEGRDYLLITETVFDDRVINYSICHFVK